ncbi:MAG TPA: nucleotidyltransferase family protein [Terriglobales bacterium]|nr:nucleotidyltransferase family protein [Terriglobales bacterium]
MSDLHAFLRLSLRVDRDPLARETLRKLAPSIDWNLVPQVAAKARLLPLLHLAWREETFVPPSLRRDLERAYVQTAARNLVVLNELAQVVAALDRAGVPSIVLKGAALLESVYGNIALRPLRDVDLLVRHERAQDALGILADRGFAAARAISANSGAAGFENELLLIKPGRVPVPLEMHWSLFDSPYYRQHLDLEDWWCSTEPFSLRNTPARMLDPVAQLLHLCGHLGLHHGGTDLLWEHDIAEVVHVYAARLDWDALLDRAVATDLVLSVTSLLLRVATEDGAPIPLAVLERLRTLEASRDERRISAYLATRTRGAGFRFWTDVASIEGWRPRLRYAWTRIFPSSEYMRARYGLRHRLWLPFYYPYRWLSALASHRSCRR